MAIREREWTGAPVPEKVATTLDTAFVQGRWYSRIKRIMDAVVSGVVLVVLSPVLIAAAAAIKLDSPGPVIFSHDRVGWDPRRRQVITFKMRKFRSMYQNCDQGIHERRIRDWARGKVLDGEGSGGELAKVAHDPRVTRVGRFIRKTSLDELPQLWNVLVGEMSLVGPRPVPQYEVDEYQAWHRARLEALPGITCFWQVRGRGQVGLDDMVRMDLEYLRSRSIWLDIKILLQTVPVVLSGRGAS